MKEIVDLETGELLDEKQLQGEINKERRIKWKRVNHLLETNPKELTIDEIEEIKKDSKVHINAGKFIKMNKIKQKDLYELEPETLGYVTKISILANRDGVIRSANNKTLFSSFNQIREYFNIGSRKWTKIKKAIVDKDIVRDGNFGSIKFLVVNPLYFSKDNIIDTYKFIAFRDCLKEHLSRIDYVYLCKLLDVDIDL